jgi:hypothetical protein
VLSVDADGLRDARLRDGFVPWSSVDVAYYQPSDRSLRVRFRPGSSHPIEPARRAGPIGAWFEGSNRFAHAYREGELCVPLRGLGVDPQQLRRVLEARTRPHRKTPYATEVAEAAASS